jgi:SEC-C motif
MPKTGRNDPCPCGSAKKYKRCCMAQDQAREQLALVAKRAQLQAQDAQHSARIGDVKAALLKGLQELQNPTNWITTPTPSSI